MLYLRSAFYLPAAAVFAASYPNRGRSENVVVTLGPSSKFSEKELNDAVRCVKRKFWEYLTVS